MKATPQTDPRADQRTHQQVNDRELEQAQALLALSRWKASHNKAARSAGQSIAALTAVARAFNTRQQDHQASQAHALAQELEEKLDKFPGLTAQEQALAPEALRERQAERACRLESDGYPKEAAEARAWGEALLEWHAWRWEDRSPAEGSMHRLALVHRGRVLAWAMQAVVQGQLHSELQVWERGAWAQVAWSQSLVHLLDWAQVMIRNNQRARGLLQRAQQQFQAQAREQRQAQQGAGRCA